MNPRDASLRHGFDGYTSNDSWTRYRPSTESGLRRPEEFKRVMQARKPQQVQKQQQNEEEIQTVTRYWSNFISNAKTVHDILSIHQYMSTMEATVQNSHQLDNVVGTSKPLLNEEDHDSNNDETTIEISSAPMFGLDEHNFEDVQQTLPSDDFIMVLNDDE